MLSCGLEGPQLELGALRDQSPLEVSHDHQDVHLEPSGWVCVSGINALARNEQGDAVRLEFADHLRQVRQGAAKPVKLVAHYQVDFLPPHHLHQPIQTFPGEVQAGDRVGDLLDNVPAVTLTISARGIHLLGDDLFVCGDSGAKGDFYY